MASYFSVFRTSLCSTLRALRVRVAPGNSQQRQKSNQKNAAPTSLPFGSPRHSPLPTGRPDSPSGLDMTKFDVPVDQKNIFLALPKPNASANFTGREVLLPSIIVAWMKRSVIRVVSRWKHPRITRCSESGLQGRFVTRDGQSSLVEPGWRVKTTRVARMQQSGIRGC